MASSLNSKRVFLMMLAAFGLVAAVICAALLAAGVREPTRERLFLVGSLVVVSIVCLALSFIFKGQTQELESEISAKQYRRLERETEDIDDVALPQNAPATEEQPDPDDIPLPQNAAALGGR